MDTRADSSVSRKSNEAPLFWIENPDIMWTSDERDSVSEKGEETIHQTLCEIWRRDRRHGTRTRDTEERHTRDIVEDVALSSHNSADHYCLGETQFLIFQVDDGMPVVDDVDDGMLVVVVNEERLGHATDSPAWLALFPSRDRPHSSPRERIIFLCQQTFAGYLSSTKRSFCAVIVIRGWKLEDETIVCRFLICGTKPPLILTWSFESSFYFRRKLDSGEVFSARELFSVWNWKLTELRKTFWLIG